MSDNKGGIKGSRILAHPLSGRAGLLREIGSSQDHGAEFEAWAKGLGDRQMWKGLHGLNLKDTDIAAFTTFIHDETSQHIIAGVKRYEFGRIKSTIMNFGKRPGFHGYWLHRDVICPLSTLTSINISPSRIVLATTKGGGLPASLYPVHFDVMAKPDFYWDSPSTSIIAPNPTGIYWASAANPRHEVCSFAIAASNGSVLLHENEGRWTLERSQCPREAVAVDWLSPNVVLQGCREGAVRLWDTRSRSESTEPRIQHPIAINHVRSIDANFLVVAGLQNELCTYDLRYSKRASPVHATQHYDRFPTYRNNVSNHLSIGLDVHRNLVATATDDRRVQIFDVKKGAELVSGIKSLGENAPCARFVDEQKSGNGLKLMAVAGESIHGWAFEGPGKRGFFDKDMAHYCK